MGAACARQEESSDSVLRKGSILRTACLCWNAIAPSFAHAPNGDDSDDSDEEDDDERSPMTALISGSNGLDPEYMPVYRALIAGDLSCLHCRQ
jgi:hypothetical protein